MSQSVGVGHFNTLGMMYVRRTIHEMKRCLHDVSMFGRNLHVAAISTVIYNLRVKQNGWLRAQWERVSLAQHQQERWSRGSVVAHVLTNELES